MSDRPERQQYRYAIDLDGETTAAKVLRLVGREKRVLELGTAMGVMTRVLREQLDCTVVGVERDPDMAAEAAAWCEKMVVGDLDRLDLAAETGDGFDVVLAADVLEHLADPWRCLAQLPALLKPEGCLVLSVPNVTHNSVVAALLCGRFPYRDKGLLDRTHLRFFARADLEQLLLATGFVPVVWDRYLQPPGADGSDQFWMSLPRQLRHWLTSRPDAEVYQFIVRARPARDSAIRLDWQRRLEAKDSEIARLQARLEAVEADLDEHRRAFAEARQLLLERERSLEELRAELAEHRKALAEAREAIAVRDEALGRMQEELTRLRLPWWRRWRQR